MSTAAIQKVVNELQGLPESDQELVLGFLQTLKQKHSAAQGPRARCGCNPALKMVDGLLIFTGELEDSRTDWIKVMREERDEEIMRQTAGASERQ